MKTCKNMQTRASHGETVRVGSSADRAALRASLTARQPAVNCVCPRTSPREDDDSGTHIGANVC